MDPYFRRLQLEVGDPMTREAIELVYREIYDEDVPATKIALKTMQWCGASAYALTDGENGQALLAYGSLRDSGCSIPEVYLDELVVAPKYRGQGLGRVMLLELEAEARNNGFSFISLEPSVAAADFYAKYDYAPRPNSKRLVRKSL